MSHISQLSLTVRYIFDGAVREDFLTFLDPHQEVFASNDDDSVQQMTLLSETPSSIRGLHAECVPLDADEADTNQTADASRY